MSGTPSSDDIRPLAETFFRGPVEFVAGAATIEQIPPLSFPEVAFAGRSNVGKSSLINALLGHTSMARTSATPGATRQINFFTLRAQLVLVDLPGYGYAKVQKTMARDWVNMVKFYLKGRSTLRRVLLLIDARRGVGEEDIRWMTMFDDAAVGYQIVLTKADQVSGVECNALQDKLRTMVGMHPAMHPECTVTSSRKKEGLTELRTHLYALLEHVK